VTKKQQQFVDIVWDFYRKNGRHTLPWRQNHDSYAVLVSELMLQQTQVQRVLPKFEYFMERWPTVENLAQAHLSEVLVAWQGLGYNRRAKFLLLCAQEITAKHQGFFPAAKDELEALPGIGPYTAGAILAFAYNQPVVFIETNIRRVFIQHFFTGKTNIKDIEIFPLIEKTLPLNNAREWYSALMDYGTHIKQTVKNPNQRSKHYVKQSKFKGSDREIRGAILRYLTNEKTASLHKLQAHLSEFDTLRLQTQLENLHNEEMIACKNKQYSL